MKDSSTEVHVSSVSADSSETLGDGVILSKSYHKVDVRLLTFYAIVAMVMQIESHNITNAAIMNIEQGTDIKHQLGDLSSEQWALILSVYDYPHFIFEPISTLLLKKMTPRKWMSRIMLSWGIISMCHGAAENFGGLMACRCLLGLAEAGFHSGVLFHLSFWFPTERMPMRIAILFAFRSARGSCEWAPSFCHLLFERKGWSGWMAISLHSRGCSCSIVWHSRDILLTELPGRRQVPDGAGEACRFAQSSCDTAKLW